MTRQASGYAPLVPQPVRVLLARFADWPLQAVRLAFAAGDPAAEAPLIVIDAGKVLARCPVAAAEGVTVGLRVREAQLRCPAAVLCAHDPEAEAAAFEPVLRAMAEVAPDVHLVRPGVAAVRARGPARFYGGEEAAARVLLGRLDAFATPDCRPSAAVADGLFCAERAAERARRWAVVPPGESARFLAGLGVECLGEPLLARQLQQLGIRTLGRYAELPRADAHARFGAAGRHTHRLASGEDLAALTPRNPASDRSVEIDLDAALAEEVVATCRPAIDALFAELAADSLALTEVRLRVRTERRRDDRLWRHPWQFDAGELANRLRWQLADLAASGPPAEDPETGGDADPVVGVQVIPVGVGSPELAARGLFGDRPEPRVIKVLTDLQERLGYREVATLVPRGGRLLKDRRLRVPFGTAPPPVRERRLDQPWPGRVPGPAPARVLQRLAPAKLLDRAGVPVTVDERGGPSADPAALLLAPRAAPRPLLAWAGPWPLDERWWETGEDARGVRADRFQVVDAAQQAWLLVLVAGACWIEAAY
ncbi:Y-family DNA polymerase [Naumannella huperziae]